MQVDDTTIVGAILTFLMGALGFGVKRMRTDIDSAHTRINKFPEEYVMKSDYRDDMQELKALLIRFEQKLDSIITNGDK